VASIPPILTRLPPLDLGVFRLGQGRQPVGIRRPHAHVRMRPQRRRGRDVLAEHPQGEVPVGAAELPERRRRAGPENAVVQRNEAEHEGAHCQREADDGVAELCPGAPGERRRQRAPHG
jgi:hypothetical protein